MSPLSSSWTKRGASPRTFVCGPNPPAALATAQAAFDDFKSVSDKLIPLSRRNSNVRSLELSLRAKPTLSAQCEESLRALQGALEKAGSRATR